MDRPLKKPDWLKIRAPGGAAYKSIKEASKKNNHATVCEEARCPNIGECWNGGTATFMLLGDICTRGCKFCAVTTGNPRMQLDPHEPEKIARTVADMDLKYIVLTSVDRDDLEDQGAKHFADTVIKTKLLSPKMIVETLTPDWRGDSNSIDIMVSSKADVLAHNIETVERLQKKVRDPRSTYKQSMHVLGEYKKRRDAIGEPVVTKSSIMLGLGEKDDEIKACMQDRLDVGVSVLTLGQYLQPTARKLPVEEYVHPDKFAHWAVVAEQMGFSYCASGPLVRSSYKAGEYYIEKILKGMKSGGSTLGPGITLANIKNQSREDKAENVKEVSSTTI